MNSKPSKAKPQAHGRDPKSTRPVIKPATHHLGEVRLIGGLWKRSKLPVADRPGLRPTPDRVRETLFNWLGQDLSGWRVLDAFAGTGALGFEAASRGATQVTLLERDAVLLQSLEATKLRLKAGGVTVQRADAMPWMLRAATASHELVFLDPPFDSGLMPAAVLAAAALLVPGGFLFTESGQALAPEPPGLTLHRSLKAGAVHAQLWQAAS
jgi:16S rRNA (guanine966-N2)-methyltransferase